jgi:hypothetical protein
MNHHEEIHVPTRHPLPTQKPPRAPDGMSRQQGGVTDRPAPAPHHERRGMKTVLELALLVGWLVLTHAVTRRHTEMRLLMGVIW